MPTATHASDPVLAHFVQAQRHDKLFPLTTTSHPVIVAVSGGLDSVTLFHILMQFASEWKLDLHVAHVDHGLRPASATDAAFVRQLAAQAASPFHLVQLNGASLRADPAGLEAAARQARYRALCTIACNVTPSAQVPILVVAHHAHDQAETLLLRLVQGSGLSGLAAMRPVTLLDAAQLTPRPVRVVRPLLALTRTELADYARRHKLTWREDESNADRTRSRNLIRHAVLPMLAQLNPQVVATLARTTTLLAEDVERLDAHDRQTLQNLIVAQDHARVLLNLTDLRRLSEGDRRGVLRMALRSLGADLRAIGAAQVMTLAAQVMATSARSGAHPLAAGLAWSIVTVDRQLILALHRQDELPIAPDGPWLDASWRRQVVRAALPRTGEYVIGAWRLTSQTFDRDALPAEWQRNPNRWTAFCDADTVNAPVLTTPQPGDRIAPLGLAGRHKLVGDLFTDAKIAPALRPGWPVIVDDASGLLLWVCGLAQAYTARITTQTRRVLALTWRHTPETG